MFVDERYASVTQTDAVLNYELTARCGVQDLYSTSVNFGHEFSCMI